MHEIVDQDTTEYVCLIHKRTAEIHFMFNTTFTSCDLSCRNARK